MSASTTNKQVSTTRNEHKPKINMQQTNKLTNSKQRMTNSNKQQTANNNQQTTTTISKLQTTIRKQQQQSANCKQQSANNNKQQTTNSKQQTANNKQQQQSANSKNNQQFWNTFFPQLYYACNHENDYKYPKISYYCAHSFIMCKGCFDAYGTCPVKCGARQKPVLDNRRFEDEGGHDRRPLPLPGTKFLEVLLVDIDETDYWL
jgi:hypothetical protein